MENPQFINSPEDPVPSSIKLPCLQSSFHLYPNSIRLEQDNNLLFTYSTLCPTTLIIKFFVYEDGLGFIPDKRYSLPDIKIPTDPCQNNRISLKLNPEYTYELSNNFPIVVEANTGEMIEVSIIEIKNNLAKVLQQRLIKNKKIFELKEIINPPLEDMDDRDKNCVICMSDLRNTIMEPCCHICICDLCANLMRTQVNRKCPMCRKGNW